MALFSADADADPWFGFLVSGAKARDAWRRSMCEQLGRGELPDDFDMKDDGWEAFDWAINHKYWSAIRFLMCCGYDLQNMGTNNIQVAHLVLSIPGDPEQTRVLLALGANPHFSYPDEEDDVSIMRSAMREALKHARSRPECVRVLVANVNFDLTAFRGVPRWLTAFQRQVRRVRACIIVFIGIRLCKKSLLHWDRFLIREVALAMWCARSE